MPAAALPPDEAERLAALRALRVLDTAPESVLDDLTRQATEVCGVPVGLVSLVDEKRQWFKSRVGSVATETPRDQSMCAHALLTPGQPLVVSDLTQDERFNDNPDVTGGSRFRFYAGFPLRSPEGLGLGTLCVLDQVPRQLSTEQIDELGTLAQQVSVQLSLRRHAPTERRLAWGFGAGLVLLCCLAVFFVAQVRGFLVSSGWVAHTHQVVLDVERTLFEVLTAESNLRAFSATGQEEYLPAYEGAVAALPGRLNTLRTAISDNPVQQRNYQVFCARIDQKLAVLRERLEQRRALGAAALDPKYMDSRGRRTMEGIVQQGREMVAMENALLQKRNADRARDLREAVGVLLGISALGASLLVAGYFLIRRELRRSHALGGQVAHANLGLKAEVAERRRAQGRLDVQRAVAQVAAGHVSLPEAAPAFLREVGERLDWEAGLLWSVDRTANRLRSVARWQAAGGSSAATAACAAFLEESRAWTFAPGEGLPGQVWARGTAVWEPRLQGAASFPGTAGMQRAFAFPLRAGRGEPVSSVMVFLGREAGAPDAELAAAMDTLAGQIDQFTERCGAEAGLRASQARFSAFIDNAPAVAYIKDEEGRALYGNETLLRTFGLRREQWLGKTDADLWPDMAAALRENDLKVLAGTGPVELRESVALPDGRMSHWLSYKFPLQDEATGQRMLAGMSIDVTAREEAEENRRAKEEAERTNQAKSRFLSRVSHELRTPLNAILGFGQLLQLSNLKEQDGEALEYILKGSKHLLALVDELLDLSRAEGGDLVLSPERVEIGGLLRDGLKLMARLAEERGISCELQGEAGGWTLWCDERRLRQVLLNLLSNAIKYNHEGGRVTVRCARAEGERLRVEVSDTGPGIEAADLPRLFVPFERLEPGDGTAKGTGLGLAVSRRIIEAMGGTMGVTSEPGRGSTFWLEMPLQAEGSSTMKKAPEDDIELELNELAELALFL